MSCPVFPQRVFTDPIPFLRPPPGSPNCSNDPWANARNAFYSVPAGIPNGSTGVKLPGRVIFSRSFNHRDFHTGVLYGLAARATARRTAAPPADLFNDDSSSSSPGPSTPTHSPGSTSPGAWTPTHSPGSADGMRGPTDSISGFVFAPPPTQPPRNVDLLRGSDPEVFPCPYARFDNPPAFLAPGGPSFPAVGHFSTQTVPAPQFPAAATDHYSPATPIGRTSTDNAEPTGGYKPWSIDSYTRRPRRDDGIPRHDLCMVPEEPEVEEEVEEVSEGGDGGVPRSNV